MEIPYVTCNVTKNSSRTGITYKHTFISVSFDIHVSVRIKKKDCNFLGAIAQTFQNR